MPPGAALDGVLEALRCPVCTGPLNRTDRQPQTLGCRTGHRFDIARQGYVALLSGRSAGLSSDTADMIAARRRALESVSYRAVRAAVAAAAGESAPASLIVDAGCGTGQYLSTCLERDPSSRGIGLDLSKYAARAAAKCHPRAAAVVADLWQPWPMADGCADVVLSVFAPRDFAQARRILADGGRLVVVTPRADHLHELIEPMGMLGVAPDKHEQLTGALAQAGLAPLATTSVSRRDEWSPAEVVDAVAMGPSAFHTDAGQLRERAAALCTGTGSTTVTTAVDITVAGS